MKNICIAIALLATVSGCNTKDAGFDVPKGSQVSIEKKDGVTVVGRLVDVKADQVVLELADGGTRTVPRADITSLRATTLANASKPADAIPAVGTGGDVKPPASAPEQKAAPAPDAKAEDGQKQNRVSEYREVTIPSGTMLPLELKTSVASDTSHVEDPVRATLRRAITVNGVQALPAGTSVSGHVSDVARSAKVKGRARLAFRFTRIDPPGEGDSASIRTGTVAREAPGTKKKDAAKIGAGAVGGAIVGGIVGGGDGAAKGAAIGGAGGTGVVLATRGKEVRLAAGTPISVRLTAPLTLRVPVR